MACKDEFWRPDYLCATALGSEALRPAVSDGLPFQHSIALQFCFMDIVYHSRHYTAVTPRNLMRVFRFFCNAFEGKKTAVPG